MSRWSYHGSVDDDRGFDVGNFTSIGGNFIVHGGDNHPSIKTPELVSNFPFKEKWNPIDYPSSSTGKGKVSIGNDVWIGEDVKMLSGVHVGDGAIIGAHAVVGKDIPAYAVAVGNPIVVKRFRFDEETIKKLLQIKWWDWDDELIRSRVEDFKDIKIFISKYG